MNLPQISTELNAKQYQSITLADDKNTLILAGAGSGKTKVLVHRIAYLINYKNISTNAILAVTFTNKAANEMKERLSYLLRRPINDMWVGTFHGLAHRLLRNHYTEAGLSLQFQIMDAQDQRLVIKKLIKINNIDDENFQVNKIIRFINKQKNEGINNPEYIDTKHNYYIKQNVYMFNIYKKYCQANELIDFADLLLLSYEMLENNQQLLQHYQQKFKHILIDEFQDINNIQYKLISLLQKDNKVFCVGDDDQSIYGWRGAKAENINRFKIDFKPIQMVILEQNYRSTDNILKASNALIINNKKRMKKSLWTSAPAGELIDIYEAYNETDEANFVAKTIKKLIQNNVNPNKCAIFYRTNVQSRVIEDKMLKYNINYTIYGGLRFFERSEIKDTIAYLRLVENHNDNTAFERIINFPARGIGKITLTKIHNCAQQYTSSLFEAASYIALNSSKNIASILAKFINLIKKIKNTSKHLNLHNKIAIIIEESGLLSHYSKDKTDKTTSKQENLKELISAASQYTPDENSNISIVQEFIDLASLDAGGIKNNKNNVQLMTIHSSKGLEFPYVFLTGMEEKLFPLIKNKEDYDNIDLINEERRLCYVGMTRAMTKLYLSFAVKRFLYGNYFFNYNSRFINELPLKYLNNIKNKQDYSSNYHTYKNTVAQYKKDTILFSTVRHSKFGIGKIINFEGTGESARVQVKFHTTGVKWLISSYANLEYIK